jgi:hypothetical protein
MLTFECIDSQRRYSLSFLLRQVGKYTLDRALLSIETVKGFGGGEIKVHFFEIDWLL